MSPAKPLLQPLSSAEEAFARALGRVIATVPRAVDADLMREQRLTLNEYSTLMHLSEAPDLRLRMTELALAQDLSLSGMTRLVGRLEAGGLIQRVQCPDDARGFHAVLTDAGLTRLKQAYPTQLASIRRHLIDHIDQADLPRLVHALEGVTAPCAEACLTDVVTD
jgi:DNA-binding MarR family transcriptional regulator